MTFATSATAATTSRIHIKCSCTIHHAVAIKKPQQRAHKRETKNTSYLIDIINLLINYFDRRRNSIPAKSLSLSLTLSFVVRAYGRWTCVSFIAYLISKATINSNEITYSNIFNNNISMYIKSGRHWTYFEFRCQKTTHVNWSVEVQRLLYSVPSASGTLQIQKWSKKYNFTLFFKQKWHIRKSPSEKNIFSQKNHTILITRYTRALVVIYPLSEERNRSDQTFPFYCKFRLKVATSKVAPLKKNIHRQSKGYKKNQLQLFRKIRYLNMTNFREV